MPVLPNAPGKFSFKSSFKIYEAILLLLFFFNLGKTTSNELKSESSILERLPGEEISLTFFFLPFPFLTTEDIFEKANLSP